MDRTTELLASYTTSLGYDALPAAAVHEAKRRLIDMFGCALGGYGSEPAAIARRLAAARSCTIPATVLGDGVRTAPETAAFANAVMVRFLDANDTFISVGSGHPSDLVPAVLAAVELAGGTGRDLLLGSIAGYELFAAIADRVNLRERGWDQGLAVVLGAAGGAGRALGLSMEQLANALAMAVTANVPTRQSRAGELSMWKGVATPAAASAGLMAALLAAEGMTGPTEAFEGRHGIWEQVTGPFEPAPLGGQEGRSFAVERSNLKYFPSEYHSQAPLWMALALREQVSPDEIERLDVETYWMVYSEIGSEPAKWDPRNRETADHSLPYLLATALRDGAITTETFLPERYLDPAIRPLMARIAVRENPEFTGRFPNELVTRMELTTKSGRKLVEESGYPKGHAQNPMTDADVEGKFLSLAAPLLGEERCRTALDTLWRLEELKGMGEVFRLFDTGGSTV